MLCEPSTLGQRLRLALIGLANPAALYGFMAATLLHAAPSTLRCTCPHPVSPPHVPGILSTNPVTSKLMGTRLSIPTITWLPNPGPLMLIAGGVPPPEPPDPPPVMLPCP